MRSEADCTECNLQHERIHLAQQREMLLIGFLIWYGIEYLVRRLQYDSWFEAYRHISFEREAYENDTKARYLETRRLYAWSLFL